MTHFKSFLVYKPIGASPGRDYVLKWMVLDTNNLVLFSTQYGMVHQKRGGTLHGLRVKKEREEHAGMLILRKPH